MQKKLLRPMQLQEGNRWDLGSALSAVWQQNEKGDVTSHSSGWLTAPTLDSPSEGGHSRHYVPTLPQYVSQQQPLLPLDFLANDKIFDSQDLHPGDELMCLGYPLGIGECFWLPCSAERQKGWKHCELRLYSRICCRDHCARCLLHPPDRIVFRKRD